MEVKVMDNWTTTKHFALSSNGTSISCYKNKACIGFGLDKGAEERSRKSSSLGPGTLAFGPFSVMFHYEKHTNPTWRMTKIRAGLRTTGQVSA